MTVYDTSAARKHVVITPHDTNPAPYCRAIFVGGTGSDITIVDSQGVEATYVGVVGVLPMIPYIIKATGTTATNIIGLV